MSTYQKTREAYHAALQEHDGEIICQQPGVDSNDWFAAPGSLRELSARKRCLDCPICFECQGYALESGVPNGTWGGIDERTRDRRWKQPANYPAGKPQHFNDEMDAAILPLPQERRDFETFDDEHVEDEPDEEHGVFVIELEGVA